MRVGAGGERMKERQAHRRQDVDIAGPIKVTF